METMSRVLRWAFVAAGPMTYWALAGWAIVSARNDPDVFAWLLAVPLTAPVSLLCMVVEPGLEWERAWFTFFTIGGAQTNGLLMGRIVWWLTRPPNPDTPTHEVQVAADYVDAPIVIE